MQARPVTRRDPATGDFYLKRVVCCRRYLNRCALISRNCAPVAFDAHFKPRIEIEKELELVSAFACELVFDHPECFALVKSDYATMQDLFGKPSISVMLCVEHIARVRAFPRVHSRADVRAEHEELIFIDNADLFFINARGVVISSRAEKVSPA